MRVPNEGCVRRGAAFFLSKLEDRLRLSFPTLIQPCYPSANFFYATVGYGRKRIVYLYMEGSETGLMWDQNPYQYPEPGRLN